MPGNFLAFTETIKLNTINMKSNICTLTSLKINPQRGEEKIYKHERENK